ncbi:MAG: EAL domain-containing protein [Acidobacteria bacterium]|nr:EAL domain-containing protein [Acidobacteriota bacterium]
MSDQPKNSFLFDAYTLSVTMVGVVVCAYAVLSFPFQRAGSESLVLALLSILVGSTVSIGIKRARLSVSVSDVFTILVFLLYGIAPAVLLSAVEAFISSSRHTKDVRLRLFNSAVMPISFFLAFLASRTLVGTSDVLTGSGLGKEALLTTFVVALSHYLVNTVLIAASSAIRSERPVHEVWKEQYRWMIVPFLATGSIALVGASLISAAGFVAFLLVLPIVGVVYFTYLSHHEKLEAVTVQAEQAETHLREMTESEERFRSAFSNAPIGIGLVSQDGNWLQVNEALCGIFGFSEEEFRHRSLADLVHPEDLIQFLNEIGKVVQRKKRMFQAELRYFNRNNIEIWTQTSISWLNASENARLICQIQDISARRKAEEKLRHDAFFDSLTDLSNYNYFMLSLSQSLTRMRETNDGFSVVFVDLDRFKLVNDSLGHRVGDRLLAAVGQRLKKCVPEEAVVARFGSDEFYLLIEGRFEGDDLVSLLDEIQKQINLVYNVSGQEISISSSFGVVNVTPEHKAVDDIMRDADTALHIAKKQGRGRYVIFDDEMRDRALHEVRLEKELGGAIERNEMHLAYQPIMDLETGEISGFEALARWNHPSLGNIPPSDFIPIAEETGQIVKLGAFVLNEACRQLAAWRDRFGRDLNLTMSVNVSPRQLLQPRLMSEVLETIERNRIPANLLKLEITESVIVDNSDVVISILKQLRAMGTTLSLDDFGTGYSSLSYLHRLPIDTLKIDRSFVSQMTTKAESEEIVKTIIVLAKNLELDTVAEGIETAEQLAALSVFGCSLGQGYYFSRPMDVASATDFIETRNTNFIAGIADNTACDLAVAFEH